MFLSKEDKNLIISKTCEKIPTMKDFDPVKNIEKVQESSVNALEPLPE